MWNWLSSLLGSKAQEPAAEFNRSAGAGTGRAPQDPESLARLQRIIHDAGLQMDRHCMEELLEELRGNRKIEAIKRIRTEGKPRLGLKEAKEIVDAF